jgi:hypothetical protein
VFFVNSVFQEQAMTVTSRRAALGVAFALAITPVAFAQAPAPASPASEASAARRWSPWIGCWKLVTERGARAAVDDAQPQVCVTAVAGGAKLTTTVGDTSTSEQTIVADGIDRAVDEAGCRGTQRTEWSQNGLRLFARADLTCAGDPTPRRVSGFAMLASDGTWLDLQAVEMASRDTVRVRRYRRTDASVASRILPGRALGIDDIREASGKVSSTALEAAIVETDAIIPLSSRMLVDLDKAGVEDRVIDVMIAMAYPDRFVVEPSPRTDRGSLGGFFTGPFSYGFFGAPIWSSAYGLYDYGNPFFYSPFAYSYYGRYNPGLYSSGGIFVVDGGGGSGSTGPIPIQPSGAGRVIDGLGYTRVRPRDSEPAQRTPGNATLRTNSSSGSSSPSSPAPSSSSDSSSGGSSVSSSGFSSGGGGGDTGRTAVPR